MKTTPTILYVPALLLALVILSPSAMGEYRDSHDRGKPTTICDARGYGADVIAEPNPDRAAESYLKKWEEVLFTRTEGGKENHYSVAHKRNYLEAGNLAEEQRSRKYIFEMIRKDIVDICLRKAAGEKAYQAYADNLAKSPTDQCKAQADIKNAYTVAQSEYAGLETFIDTRQKTNKLSENLPGFAKQNRIAVEKLFGKILEAPGHSAIRRTYPDAAKLEILKNELQREMRMLWSSKTMAESGGESKNTDISADGIYADMLLQIEKEKQLAKYNIAKLDAAALKMAVCKPIDGVADTTLVPAEDQQKPPPGEGTVVAEKSPEQIAAEQKALDDENARIAAAEAEKSKTPIVVPEPPAKVEPPPVTTTEEKGPGFFARNKGLIIAGGVGAVAIGGILVYKKQQDNKARDKEWNMEAEAMAAVAAQKQNSSSSSSSSSNSSSSTVQNGSNPATNATPQGSILIITGVPSGAQVESNLSQITVSIVGPNGVGTQDSNTNVSLSCEVPSPCSITGTLTVNTDNGKAVFDDVRFTSKHTGVKLKVAAPGFKSVFTTSTFDVTQ